MEIQKITIFAGHYGSGKTNIALNYAFFLKEQGKDVALCDLDIVNPYFRTKDSERLLEDAGIRLISSEFANSNVDLPSIPADAYSMFANNDTYTVIDLGGDDRGAYALGRYSHLLLKKHNVEMLLVINKYRPNTRNADEVLEIKQEIENACHFRFTGIVNNSNLGSETKTEYIENSVDFAYEVSRITNLPLVLTTYMKNLNPISIPNPFPINIFSKEIWQI